MYYNKERPRGSLNNAQWFKYFLSIQPCLQMETSCFPPGSSPASVLQFSRKHIPIYVILGGVADTWRVYLQH